MQLTIPACLVLTAAILMQKFTSSVKVTCPENQCHIMRRLENWKYEDLPTTGYIYNLYHYIWVALVNILVDEREGGVTVGEGAQEGGDGPDPVLHYLIFTILDQLSLGQNGPTRSFPGRLSWRGQRRRSLGHCKHTSHSWTAQHPVGEDDILPPPPPSPGLLLFFVLSP